jgi:hypothetical protein
LSNPSSVSARTRARPRKNTEVSPAFERKASLPAPQVSSESSELSSPEDEGTDSALVSDLNLDSADDDLEAQEERWIIQDEETSNQHRHQRRRRLASSSINGFNGSDGNSSDDDDDGDDDVFLEFTEFPPGEGRAVVTWSGDDDSEADDLEELLALAESDMISSSGADDGEMWYQEISGSESSGEDDGNMLIMEGWAPASFTRDGVSDEEYGDVYMTDDGDTTDSLDDTDHVALVRFGIEVDADGSDADAGVSHASADFANGDRGVGVVSTEDGKTTISMSALAENPRAVVAETAQNLGVNRTTAAKILASVGISVLMGNEGASESNRRSPRGARRRPGENAKTEEKDSSQSTAVTSLPPRAPPMGTFFPSATGPESTVVIDGSSNPVPSPFSSKKTRSLRRVSRSKVSLNRFQGS